MDNEDINTGDVESSLDAKVRFLSQPSAYVIHPRGIVCRETHMSWVFLAGDMAYKLKKPVRFPYLDFATVGRREAACRAEVRLNRRLAPDVYLDVQPLTVSHGRLEIGGVGPIVDWLVVMRRLDESLMLDRAIAEGWLHEGHVDRFSRVLVDFYRCAKRVFVRPDVYVAKWRQSLALNYLTLANPQFSMPVGLIRLIDRAQRQFVARRSTLLEKRARAAAIVDGHGDLRPEHIWLGDSIRIIDCLEFNAGLRMVDPLDEVAYLSVECDRLGADWVGKLVRDRVMGALHDGVTEDLFAFYRCYRATLRARLTIAHLLEANPRTPKKWPPLAKAYLALAAADARFLERSLKRRPDR